MAETHPTLDKLIEKHDLQLLKTPPYFQATFAAWNFSLQTFDFPCRDTIMALVSTVYFEIDGLVGSYLSDLH